MKFNASFFLIFCVLGGGINPLLAQRQTSNHLCFNETYTESISIENGIDFETLNIYDKLEFKEKIYNKKHHNYFNGVGKLFRDTHFNGHTNIYPKWYNPPTTIKINSKETKTIFTEENNPNVVKDEIIKPHSDKALKYFTAQSKAFQQNGLTLNYRYYEPNRNDLSVMQDEGYLVTVNQHIINAKNDNVNLIWDTSEKIMVTQVTDGDKLVKTTTNYYKFNRIFNENLLFKSIETTPKRFSNGSYFEKIKTKIFENYSNKCKSSIVEYRLMSFDNLELYPNPGTNSINVLIPNADLKTNLKVSGINGTLMLERNLKKGSQQCQINVNHFPPGIYYVNVQQGVSNYITKFVKQ